MASILPLFVSVVKTTFFTCSPAFAQRISSSSVQDRQAEVRRRRSNTAPPGIGAVQGGGAQLACSDVIKSAATSRSGIGVTLPRRAFTVIEPIPWETRSCGPELSSKSLCRCGSSDLWGRSCSTQPPDYFATHQILYTPTNCVDAR